MKKTYRIILQEVVGATLDVPLPPHTLECMEIQCSEDDARDCFWAAAHENQNQKDGE